MPLNLGELSRFQQCMSSMGLDQATLDIVSACLQRTHDAPGVNVPLTRLNLSTAKGHAVFAKELVADDDVAVAALDSAIQSIDDALENLEPLA